MYKKTKKTILPPKSWKNLSTHYLTALEHPWYKLLTQLQSELYLATVQFYQEKSLPFFLLPITTGAISSPMGLGSDSSPVKVKIQGIETYLADSMQFFLEYACRINKKGAYYIAPSFRGEPADRRHLSQFYHSEAEIVGTLDDVINLVQDYIIHLARHFLTTLEKEIAKASGSVAHLEYLVKNGNNIPRCSFDEAAQKLDDNPKYIKHTKVYRNITSEGEKELMRYFGGYVWITHFDHMAVPFYQKYKPGSNKKKAINADLLIGIGETVGAGERHYSGKEVQDALKMHQVKEQPYSWYIAIKNIIPLQTSGFGLGVERFLLWVLQHDDIRDMQLLPRFNGIPSVF